MLNDFGVHLEVSPKLIQIQGNQNLKATTVQVPGDPSTAAFWIAAASMIPGTQLQLENISLNPTRLGFLRVLQRMGANIQIETTSEKSEPVGRIRVTSQDLQGVRVLKTEISSLIDEIPLLAVIATQAKGFLEVEGAEELRVKESDRLEAVAANLRAMGAEIEVRNDGFRIKGIQELKGAKIESYHDHRIAMAFSIAALVARGPSELVNGDCAKVSYPDFFNTLRGMTQ
jgi:3-phosphoshikimate 1-carboxyvinyltransferase